MRNITKDYLTFNPVTLSSARTLSKHKPTVAPSVDCEHLTDALYRVYKEVILPLYSREQVKAEIMTAVGIDPENREQLMQFSCGLQGKIIFLGEDVCRHFSPSAGKRQDTPHPLSPNPFPVNHASGHIPHVLLKNLKFPMIVLGKIDGI